MAATVTSSSSTNDIIFKPENDRRLYRVIELENGLQTLLVSDSVVAKDAQNQMAAAAMSVRVGSLSDPINAPGRAHLLEHMLFMGSDQYPNANEFDEYLSEHGGSSDGKTNAESTSFHFTVKREFLEDALKRFASFFISPLLKVETIEGEVKIVDSEFKMHLLDDFYRLQQLRQHTSIRGHRYNKFLLGNKESLLDAENEDTNLQKQLLELFDEYYHGGLMKLVVIGGEPLDALQDMVFQLFNPVKKAGQEPVSNTDKGIKRKKQNSKITAEGLNKIWKSGKVYRLETVSDVNILALSWTLPCLRQDYEKKPAEYIDYILGSECKGCLFSFLKDKGWATFLHAGLLVDGILRTSIADIFVVTIHLTRSGVDQLYNIIGYVYQYLNLLRNASPQQWIFEELKDIEDIHFRFAEELSQEEYAAKLAENLHIYRPEHVICGDYLFKTRDDQLIKETLGFFNPDNMRVDFISELPKKLKGIKKEPWYGSSYVEEVIPPFWMKKWKSCCEVDVSLRLPSKNEFIPSDFSICVGDTHDAKLPNSNSPRCIVDDALRKIWYKKDTTFKVPCANMYFQIYFKGGYDSVKIPVLFEMFIHLLKDELNESIFQADNAGLQTAITYDRGILDLRVYGFNEKLHVLLHKVLSVASSLIPTVDRYMATIEEMIRELSIFRIENQCSILRSKILFKIFYDDNEKLDCLSSLKITDLEKFISELKSQIYIEGLCIGNLTEGEVTQMTQNVYFSENPLPIESRHVDRVICLPSNANLVRDFKAQFEENSMVELYFQIKKEIGSSSIRLKAFFDLFKEIVREPFFNQMRTVEQLGYGVESEELTINEIFGFRFSIMSSEYDPIYIQEKIEGFIDGLEALLDRLSDHSFQNHKNNLISKLLDKDLTLTYEADRLWKRIVTKSYIFDFEEKEARILSGLSKQDFVEWCHMYFKQSSPGCRRLFIRIWGKQKRKRKLKGDKVKSNDVQEVKNVANFKKQSEFY